jgi:NAD(P)-dependent dehydrogenase (short-subunit alcohol dehydrogenase family)
MKVLVTGASSGTGAAIYAQLKRDGHEVWGASLSGPDIKANFERPGEVAQVANAVGYDVDAIVHCVGVNFLQPIDTLSMYDFNRLFQVNCAAGVHLTRLLLPGLKERNGVVCSIVSNASEIPMTHSLAYNVSKAAQAMAVKQMAHELSQDSGVTVFGISPAKIANTEMSEYIDNTVPEMRGWTPEFARDYQLKSLKSGVELEPEQVADFAVWLLSRRSRSIHLNGLLVPYGN